MERPNPQLALRRREIVKVGHPIAEGAEDEDKEVHGVRVAGRPRIGLASGRPKTCREVPLGEKVVPSPASPVPKQNRLAERLEKGHSIGGLEG